MKVKSVEDISTSSNKTERNICHLIPLLKIENVYCSLLTNLRKKYYILTLQQKKIMFVLSIYYKVE